MKNAMIFAAKTVAVFVALIIGQMVSGMVILAAIHGAIPAMATDGPFTAAQAMPVIAAANAIILALLAANMRWSTWGKAAAVFVIFYILETGLSQIEAWYFNSYMHVSPALLTGMALGNLVKAALAAVVCALLWPSRIGEPAESLGGLVWKMPVIIPLYIVFYFGAGALIAWQGAAVRAYYQQGFHIDTGQLALLQVLRGAIWAGVALLIVKSLKGGVMFRALMTGLAFAVLMALVLLLPNSFMPWDVRKMHLMEIFSSNLLFGILAALILMIGKKRAEA